MTKRQPAVAIVGAGMSGLCAPIMLQRAGIDGVTSTKKPTRSAAPGATIPIPA